VGAHRPTLLVADAESVTAATASAAAAAAAATAAAGDAATTFCEMANLSSTPEHGEHVMVGSARLELYAQAYSKATTAGRAPPQAVVNFEVGRCRLTALDSALEAKM